MQPTMANSTAACLPTVCTTRGIRLRSRNTTDEMHARISTTHDTHSEGIRHNSCKFDADNRYEGTV